MRSTRNAIMGVALLAGLGFTTQVHTFASPAAAKHVKITTKTGGPAFFMFSPLKTTVSVGTVVTWTNTSGQVPHNVRSMTSSWHFKKDLGPHTSVSYTFTKKGVYKYQCTIHPGMKGQITVK
ncbi:MAG TPA: plastocyanin/azurin family copper-binding protein [Chloroflexota bacterium]